MMFALIPDNLDLSSTMVSAQPAGTAADAQECVDLAAAADATTVAISFDEGTGDCQYATKVYSHYLREAGLQPKFYLRVDNLTTSAVTLESTCFTNQDAEYALMRLSYGEEDCIQGSLDSTTGLCIATEYSFEYGDYTAGNLDGNQYLLTKDQVTDSVNYACTDEEDPKAYFGGSWWCYAALVFTSETPSSDLVANDYCASTYSGSNVVWVTEKREYGYLYYWWPDKTVYMGLILDSGTSVHDGTIATDLPWATSPVGGSNNLVKVNDDFTVTDTTASAMELLCCKYPAPAKPYDPSAKFK